MIDPQLLARIDAVAPVSFTGQAFRHIAQDHHPLSGVGARTHGGRWNPPDSFSTLYLALERETTVLEFYRLVKRQGRTPEDFLPRRMYRYDIALTAILDLRDPPIRVALQLSETDLRSDDAAKCQQIGESAHYLGLEGILAPSAAGEGNVLAVFFDRLHADSQVRDLDHEPWTAPPEAARAP
ncbi:MAG: RES family NAD+ phosphorylase [Solirubrobacterales bacterium]|nr:RES family NAD+ phosphorylase [Solirubrobacterales bacterium]